MPSTSPLVPQPDDRLAFFHGFLRRPRQVGSIIPSSRFLERRITRAAQLGNARLVVELGPGTGGTTRALLRAMRPSAQLLSIEINPHFVKVLDRTRDRRLHVHRGSASDICKILDARGLGQPDTVLSGIPFSTMPRALGESIVRAVYEALGSGGLFVAYQVRDRVEGLGNQVFGRCSVETELLNVPPMRVYRWQKRGN
jgi:phosphatidylethanolamine/phosphatidyl-N-methylethanolamine N-methyltransferase